MESAHLIIRYCPQANRFYPRKKDRTNGAAATKALTNKLARATYCMIRDQKPFEVKKLLQNSLDPAVSRFWGWSQRP